MAYKALYRKYRPETFDSVVGQGHIIKTLQNAIANNKVAHAYIFSGPRGTGKTTTAKLLAKALNCPNEEKPCNFCVNCSAINEGTHPDIIEIDAASNNGVDEIRDLIEKVKYAPIQGKFKVYIIDEVHMMTPGAFNALLKTLEEPPAHVVFILATTDVHKVIPTVLSRCQRFDFSKINYDDIKHRIIEVLELENITFEESVPALVAELADGGMRDALSILDQVVSYAGDHITMQHIYDIYGMMSNQDMVEYLTLLAENKTKEVLAMIENYIGKGIDVKRLTYDLMVCLKDAIVYRSTSDESILERLNADYAKAILRYYSTSNALKVTELLNEARNNYRLSTNYRLFFELASLKIIEALASNPNIFNEEINTTEKVIEPTKVVEVKVEPIVEEKQPVIEPIKVIEDKVVETIAEPIKEEPVAVETPKIIEEKVVEVKKEPIKEEVNVEPVKEETVKTNTTNNKYETPTESEAISYTLDEYVNILCQGDKKFKDYLITRWGEIRRYIDNLDTRYVAQLLSDSSIGVANKEFILLVYDFKLLASRAKQRNNLILIRRFIKEVFNYDLEVYVVERGTFIDMTNRYYQLRQVNKLPQPRPIPRLVKEEIGDDILSIVSESEELKDATIELGRDLFGDALKIE